MLAVSSTSLWYTMRATGIVGLVLLSATMVLGLLTAGRITSPGWPAFATADLHKRVSVLTMVFVGLHVLTAVADTYVHIGWLAAVVPFTSTYRPLWIGLGSVSIDIMLALAISGILRQHISVRTWRGIHWLAYASWPLAMAHSLGMGTDAATLWMDAIAAICACSVLAALAWRTRVTVVERRLVRTHTGNAEAATPIGPTARRRQLLGGRRPPAELALASRKRLETTGVVLMSPSERT